MPFIKVKVPVSALSASFLATIAALGHTVLKLVVECSVVRYKVPRHRIAVQRRSRGTIRLPACRLLDSGRVHDLGADGDGKGEEQGVDDGEYRAYTSRNDVP